MSELARAGRDRSGARPRGTQVAPTSVEVEAGRARVAVAVPVAGLLRGREVVLQPKLDVGPVDDPAELEADAVARSVVAALAGAVRPVATGPASPPGGPAVRRVGRLGPGGPSGGPVPEATERALQSARGSGAALPAETRAALEPVLGTDLGGVRVHTGRVARSLSEELGARAFTVGSDVFFREGLPDVRQPSGQHLLAHELTHVVQQGGGTRVQRDKTEQPAQATPTKASIGTLLEGAAPRDKVESRQRMADLRALLARMPRDVRVAIADDAAMMAKGLAYLGPLEYMSFMAAVGMNKSTRPAASGTGREPVPGAVAHMSGAEADDFIGVELPKHPHLRRFLEAALAAGLKGDGFIAVVDDLNWGAVYETEFPSETMGTEDETDTNAYASDGKDGPAIINANRGTRSTAVHESMHRYAPNDFIDAYRSALNEGVTEYFTRLITDRNGEPVSKGGPARDNYEDNFIFVRDVLLPVLGSSKAERETTLAAIYFSGQVSLLEERFLAACTAASTTGGAATQKWESFGRRVRRGDWAGAAQAMP